ncbi:MAG TPA: hypothetical protein VFQ53_35565 [Kofleriaceae bacterium]|nr:hypothetical protein [Kofleriaceae bacterium]
MKDIDLRDLENVKGGLGFLARAGAGLLRAANGGQPLFPNLAARRAGVASGGGCAGGSCGGGGEQ